MDSIIKNNKNLDNKVTINRMHIKYTNLFCLALPENLFLCESWVFMFLEPLKTVAISFVFQAFLTGITQV